MFSTIFINIPTIIHKADLGEEMFKTIPYCPDVVST